MPQSTVKKTGCSWALAASCGACVALVVALYFARGSRQNGCSGAKMGSGRMFDSIAKRYDHINKLMSLGMDMQWRQFMVDSLELRSGDKVLDLATGTADVAILVGREVQRQGLEGVSVVGLDPSAGMLEVGRQKVDAVGLGEQITLVQGDAQVMGDLPSDAFDKITMSFGIRNVEHRVAALKEMTRVARKDSSTVVAILEFAMPTSGALRVIGQFMVKYGAPLIGALLTGLRDEYQHLQKSILEFPSPQDFAAVMGTAGLDVYDIKETGFGVVTLYLARPRLVKA